MKFIFIFELISIKNNVFLGQDNQIWSKKRTRRLYGTTFPEYAAIDNIGGGAICVASQNEYQFYFDSEGIVRKKIADAEKGEHIGVNCLCLNNIA